MSTVMEVRVNIEIICDHVLWRELEYSFDGLSRVTSGLEDSKRRSSLC